MSFCSTSERSEGRNRFCLKKDETIMEILNSMEKEIGKESINKERQKLKAVRFDEQINEIISSDEFDEWGLFEQKHIRLCFKLGLNEVLKKLHV